MGRECSSPTDILDTHKVLSDILKRSDHLQNQVDRRVKVRGDAKMDWCHLASL